MPDVMFKLSEDLAADALDEVLRQIESLPGVEAAGQVKSNASRPSMRALCYARVGDETDPQAVVSALEAMPGVSNAQLAPQRGLA